jgi:hypothetical protein
MKVSPVVRVLVLAVEVGEDLAWDPAGLVDLTHRDVMK